MHGLVQAAPAFAAEGVAVDSEEFSAPAPDAGVPAVADAAKADRLVQWKPPEDLKWTWKTTGWRFYLAAAVLNYEFIFHTGGKSKPSGAGGAGVKRVDKKAPSRQSVEQSSGFGRKFLFHEDSEFFALYDGFPKAAVHLLLVPKAPLDSAVCVQSEAFLEAYIRYLEQILGILARLFPEATFRHGVHATPSLHQMHCHVVSQDFVPSDGQDRFKKHWQSFQEPFLVPLCVLRKVLFPARADRAASSELEKYLKICTLQTAQLRGFKCPRCGEACSLEQAFNHLRHCESALPATWPTRDTE